LGKRAEINHLDRFKQSLAFSGMIRHRNISPTDIDMFYDYNGKAFVYGEGKAEERYNTVGLEYGQRKALENLVNSNARAGHKAIAIIFTHQSKSDELIYVKDKPVREIYFEGVWSKCNGKTVIEVVDRFERYCKNLKIEI
jgi:hypothetical protein